MSDIRIRDALNELDDKRIKQVKPLIQPQILMEDFPLTFQAAQSVILGRSGAESIIKGQDDRLLVIVGPCSVHSVPAALEYAERLSKYSAGASSDLAIIMRVYFEKPRTTVGWKGLINDPKLNNSFQINQGLRVARNLLLDINQLGVPCGCEFLDTITPQYIADLVAWGAIGARTTESQVHRELASGLSVPVGFKNGTNGSIDVAVDAIKAASAKHNFLSVTKQGLSAIGNDSCHIILRGGTHEPNYSAENVKNAVSKLEAAKLTARIMIDCSHGNSQKVFSKQVDVVKDIVEQLKTSPTGFNIMGVMIESNLVEGRQDLPPDGGANLTYGQSITDACIGWETTVQVLDLLREGVHARRTRNAALICLVKDTPSIDDLLLLIKKHNFDSILIPRIEQVPKYPAIIKSQFISEDNYGQSITMRMIKRYMQRAIELAKIAKSNQEIPIGCVIVDPKGLRILAECYDSRATTRHPLKHAIIKCLDVVTSVESCNTFTTQHDYGHQNSLKRKIDGGKLSNDVVAYLCK
ncbi:9006_t:CDS:10, partial [Entrophospora sp. SA101]